MPIRSELYDFLNVQAGGFYEIKRYHSKRGF